MLSFFGLTLFLYDNIKDLRSTTSVVKYEVDVCYAKTNLIY